MGYDAHEQEICQTSKATPLAQLKIEKINR